MKRRLCSTVFLSIVVFCVADDCSGSAFSSPLSDLASPHAGRMLHEGSWDRQHENNDYRSVKPGEILTIFDHRGAGTVHRFWIATVPRRDVAILSQVILRMYWDDDAYPSVECPIGAFFGVGFGEQKDYISAPMDETSGGYNSYWPMPFHKSARWTVSNESDKTLRSLYYNIDYTASKRLPAATRHFHAQFRRENPTTPGRDYTILETAGEGHYVGTALFMSGRSLFFLEGNDRVFIDGSRTPSIEGTGTEDYFSSGWYFDQGLYSAPYHGVVIKEERPARISAYRWHIEDAIPFTQSIRFTIEHGAQNTVSADYSSVAYYYLAGPSPKPPSLPSDLLPSHVVIPTPMSIPGAIEAETLKATAKATSGTVDTSFMDGVDERNVWSNGQVLWWSPAPEDKDAELTLELPSNDTGEFGLVARAVAGPSSGIVQFVLGGQPVGEPTDLWAEGWQPIEIPLGTVPVKGGSVRVAVRAAGRNPRSKDSTIGLDAFILKPPH